MNVNPAPNQRIDPRLWRHSEARLALARRDVGAVYRLLNTRGIRSDGSPL